MSDAASTTRAAGAPPAGWYTDPKDAAHARWWDGSAWTANRRPLPPVTPRIVSHTGFAAAQVSPAQVAPAPAPAAAPAPTPFGYAAAATPDPPAPGVVTGAPAWMTAAGYTEGLPTGWGHRADPVVTGPVAAWGSPHTVAAWLMAVLPIVGYVGGGLSVVGGLAAGLGPASVLLAPAVWLVFLLLTLLLASGDVRRLRGRGVTEPASAGWVLLAPPVLYLILRATRVARAGRRAIGPPILAGVVVLAVLVIAIASGVAGASRAVREQSAARDFGVFDGSGALISNVTPTRSDVAFYVKQHEHAVAGRTVAVDCGDGMLADDDAFSCAGTTPSSEHWTFAVRFSAGAQLTYTAMPGITASDGFDPADPAASRTRLELTTPTPRVTADGHLVGGGEPTPAELGAYALGTVRASGRDWTDGDCLGVDFTPSTAGRILDCTVADPAGSPRAIEIAYDGGLVLDVVAIEP